MAKGTRIRTTRRVGRDVLAGGRESGAAEKPARAARVCPANCCVICDFWCYTKAEGGEATKAFCNTPQDST